MYARLKKFLKDRPDIHNLPYGAVPYKLMDPAKRARYHCHYSCDGSKTRPQISIFPTRLCCICRGKEVALNALAEQPYIHNSEAGNKTYNALLVGIVPFAVSVHANNAQAAIALCDAVARGNLRF